MIWKLDVSALNAVGMWPPWLERKSHSGKVRCSLVKIVNRQWGMVDPYYERPSKRS
jgi:hypothetical protein